MITEEYEDDVQASDRTAAGEGAMQLVASTALGGGGALRETEAGHGRQAKGLVFLPVERDGMCLDGGYAGLVSERAVARGGRSIIAVGGSCSGVVGQSAIVMGGSDLGGFWGFLISSPLSS